MGTRNLTCVVQDGEYKIAQYGQWDGYPSGQGLVALNFLQNVNLDEFREKIKQVKFLTTEDLKLLDDNTWKDTHPQLSRDICAHILQFVMDDYTEFVNSVSFAGDSLFCEWAYVIDLDKNTFEVYNGFNQRPLDESERFYGIKPENRNYEPVKHIYTFDLLNLPTEEEFLEILNPAVQEE